MFNFSINIKNNTGAKVATPLFNPGGFRGVYNSPIKFSADLSSVSLNVATVGIQVAPNGSSSFITYTAPLLTQTIQGVADALNTLNVGLFWVEGDSVVTNNSLYTYSNIIIGEPSLMVFEIDYDIAAPVLRTIQFKPTSAVTGFIDWGDGTIDPFSGGPAFINLNHNYTAPGIYTAVLSINDEASVVQKFGVPNSTVLAIRPLGLLSSLDAINIQNNLISSLDISNNPQIEQLVLTGNSLTTLDISNNPVLMDITASVNNLTVAAVNSILAQLDAFGLLNGIVDLSGQVPAAPPSGAGIVAANNLTIKGWLVLTD